MPNRSAADAIGALVLRCPRGGGAATDAAAGQAAPQCTWTGRVSDLGSHESTCAAVLVPCKWAACSVATARSASATHEAECAHREVFCKRCSDVLRGADAIASHDASCDGTPVPCPNAGCSAQARRGDLRAHRATCGSEVIRCSVPSCGARFKRSEADAHHVSAAGTHTAALVGMVQTLSSNMTGLNSSLQALNSSIQTLSRAVPELTTSLKTAEQRHTTEEAAAKRKRT